MAVCMMVPSLQVSAAESNVVLEPQKPEVVDAVYEYDEIRDEMVLVDTDVVLEEVVGADLPQIDAPTNVKWGDKTKGEMLYTPSVNGLGVYVFSLYKDGEEKPIYTSQHFMSVTNNEVRKDYIDPEIVEKMEEFRDKMQTFFVLDNLDFLKKNGTSLEEFNELMFGVFILVNIMQQLFFFFLLAILATWGNLSS